MITIKKFWAEWCGPCKAYAPQVDKVVASRTDVKLEEVNIEEQPEVAQTYGVQGVPYTVLERDGKILGGFKGSVPAKKLNEILDGFAELDSI